MVATFRERESGPRAFQNRKGSHIITYDLASKLPLLLCILLVKQVPNPAHIQGEEKFSLLELGG